MIVLLRMVPFLLLIMSMLLCQPVCAEWICVDGIYYGLIGTRRAYVVSPDLRPDAEPAYRGDVIVPASVSHNGHTYTVMSVGESAFAGCDDLHSVHLPSTVQAISACAFVGCEKLQEVAAPRSLQAVGSGAFMGCVSLRSDCLSRHAELVDSLTYYCCTVLPKVMLPYRLRRICSGAYRHCRQVRDIYCFAEEPPVAEVGAFSSSVLQDATLHVPSAVLARYRKAASWQDVGSIVELTDADYADAGYIRGDVNDDGQIDVADYNLLRRYIVALPAEGLHHWAADVNADGKVNAQDLVLICRKACEAH